MLRWRQSSLPTVPDCRLSTWRQGSAYSVAFSIPVGGHLGKVSPFPFSLVNGGNCYVRTIPAGVRFGFFQNSRLGSEGNSFENIEGPVETDRDVLSLNKTPLRPDNTQLE